MKKWLMAVLLGTVLVLGACGGGDDGSDDTSVDEGTGSEDATVDASEAEGLYKDNCASCHGADLSGGAGPDLTAVGGSMSAEEIEAVIVDGAPGMPGGLISGDDAKAVAEWLAEKK